MGFPQTPPATGDASTVDFGYGVTLTLASGWTVANQGPHYANLVKDSGQKGGWTSAPAQRTRTISTKNQPC